MRSHILIAGLLLTGCAGETALRSASAQSGAVLTQYRKAMTEVAASQSELNRSIDLSLKGLDTTARLDRSEVETQMAIWQLAGNKPAIESLRQLTAVGTTEILADGAFLNPLPETPAPAALKFDATAVDKVIKGLTALSKKPGAQTRIEDFLAYTGKLRQAYDAAADEAAEEAETAEPATAP